MATVSTNVSYIPLLFYINAATCYSHKMHTKRQTLVHKEKKENPTMKKKKFLYSFNYEFHSFSHSLTLIFLFSSNIFLTDDKIYCLTMFCGKLLFIYLSIFINFNFGSFIQSHCTQSIVPMHMLFNFIWHNTFIKFWNTLTTNNEKSYPNFTELKMYLKHLFNVKNFLPFVRCVYLLYLFIFLSHVAMFQKQISQMGVTGITISYFFIYLFFSFKGVTH